VTWVTSIWDRSDYHAVERSNIIIYVNNNIISLEIVVFCAIDDETNDYLKREFASMKDFVRLLIN
jgi:hypothetical protein